MTCPSSPTDNVQEAFLYAEDELGISLLTRLLREFAPGLSIGITKQTRGLNALNDAIPRACKAAYAGFTVFFLADLDRVTCATKYFARLKHKCDCQRFVYRLAKREAEAWLLADREGFAEEMRVHPKHIPDQPEEILDPKEKLLAVIRKSRSRSIREALLPQKSSGYRLGRAYNLVLCEFAEKAWNISNARKSSPSLENAIRAIERTASDLQPRTPA